MNDQLTDINVVLDRSGSMASIATDTIGGFNTFIQGQKEAEGEATVTLAQFDDVYEVVHNGINVNDVPELTSNTFVPRGCTALHDAIGKTIATTGQRLAAMKEEDRPGKVIFLVLTDGGENASKEYTGSQIKAMIKEQTDTYNWDFIFLGANQDAVTVGASMGFAVGNSLTYAATSVGATTAFTSMNEKMTMYRSGALGACGAKGDSGQGAFFDANDRKLQADAGV